MKHQKSVQVAVQCLQALDANEGRPLSLQALSQTQGVPFAECANVISRLSQAGIVEVAPGGQVALLRPVEELTALEIVQAVWTLKDTRPAFRMLVGGNRGIRWQVTRDVVRAVDAAGREDICNG